MRLKDVRTVINVILGIFAGMFVLGFVLACVIPDSTRGPLLFCAVEIVLAIALLIFRYNYWNCPVCKKPLERIGNGTNYCQNCGKEINWESWV